MEEPKDKRRNTRQEASEPRKSYTKPAILHELELETRAGSPLGIPDPFEDPFGSDREW
jgi:hypothetical protein